MMVMGWIDQVMDRDFILTVDTSHFQPSNIGGTYLFGLILKPDSDFRIYDRLPATGTIQNELEVKLLINGIH